MTKIPIGKFTAKHKKIREENQKAAAGILFKVKPERITAMGKEMDAVTKTNFTDRNREFRTDEYLEEMLPVAKTAGEQLVVVYLCGRRLGKMDAEMSNPLEKLVRALAGKR